MTVLETMRRGFRASVTLNNINLSEGYEGGSPFAGGGGGIDLVGGNAATYEQLYRTQPWVHTVVNRLSRGIGRLPWAAYTDADEPEARERRRDGALADLLYQPADGWSPSRFKQAIIWNMGIHGNVVIPKIRPGVGRPPRELIPSAASQWYVITGRGREIDWYVWRGPNGPVPFLPEEVLHIRFYGGRPWSPSPLEALRRTLMAEDAEQRDVIASYENGLRTVGAISVNQQLKREVAERLRDQIRATYGGVDNAYKIMLMEGDAKWHEMSMSYESGALIELRKLNREEVTAVYNVPPPVVGILDRATFSNITEQHRMEAQDTMDPYTTLIQDEFRIQMIQQEPTMRGQYIEFNYKEMLRGDPIREIDALTKAAGGPYLLVDEARATQNLPPLNDPALATVRSNPGTTTPATPDERETDDI